MNLRKNKAFTLIELLVVIAIIGILAALIIVSLSGARERAADTQIKNNTRSLATALEQYSLDQSSASYPSATGTVVITGGTVAGTVNGAACATLSACLDPYLGGGGIFDANKYLGATTAEQGYASTGVAWAAGALLNNENDSNENVEAGAAGGITVGGITLSGFTDTALKYVVTYGPQ